MAMPTVCQCLHPLHSGCEFDSTRCWRSLLSNLRKLSLDNVAFPLPALQPIATRLRSLDISDSRLRGSADGFLSAGWTALDFLRLGLSWVEDDVLTAVNLPALKTLDILSFEHQGGTLELDQLCCPQLRNLTFLLHSNGSVRVSEGGRQCCSLLNVPRLENLVLRHFPQAKRTDLGLPASLQHWTVQDTSGGTGTDLAWVLLEAVKCIRSGAKLRSLTCTNTSPPSYPEGVPWGASSVAHYRDLGQQLRGLKDLSVCSRAPTILSAVGAVACAAPDLTRLQFRAGGHPDDMQLTLVSSASLKSITGRFELYSYEGPPPPVVLTFLHGCTQLRDVRLRVQFFDSMPEEGTSVKIRCHCTSQDCILPLDACAGLDEVDVQFLPMPPSPRGLQAYTVIYTYHAAGPKQGLKWSHAVMPGVL